MSIRAVIFDFNGVLVDDESVHFSLFQRSTGPGRRYAFRKGLSRAISGL